MGLRLILLITLSIVLMVLDHRDNYFAKARSFLSVVVAPLQYAVDGPIRMIGWIEYSVSSRQELLKQNTRLRYQQLMLQAELQKLIALKHENKQLRALLKSTTQFGGKVMAAQLLAIDTTPYNRIIILDKGKRDGVYVGQPVLDAHGVMGQVIDVSHITSSVLLITDAKSAVPVQINRTGERAIVAGIDDDILSLNNLSKTADIRVGDLLVTSGLDHRYPEGYPIGTVAKVSKKPGAMFALVSVIPAAHLNRSRVVLLLWPRIKQL